MKLGGQSEVGKIESLLVKHPRDGFINQGNIDAQWQKLNYLSCPEYEKSVLEYEDFLGMMKRDGIDIHFLPVDDNTGLDSVYVRDPVAITPQGAVLCNMGKPDRRGEAKAIGKFLTGIGVDILGRIESPGTLEGGDIVWLDPKTLVVGQGYRTNAEGIRQLKNMTAEFVDDFVVVPLPHWTGPDDVLHLMSFISPIDVDLAAVYSRLMPVPFRQYLIDRGITLVEVPDEEYDSMACNILAVSPRSCIMLAGNPKTKAGLESRGVEVREFAGYDISRKGCGGPTCLTRPLRRKE
ncbi:MAG: hypothetical protein GY841_13045 [FCB group bacterium]|nr:hypothetical protein [FCB group bacterium]